MSTLNWYMHNFAPKLKKMKILLVLHLYTSTITCEKGMSPYDLYKRIRNLPVEIKLNISKFLDHRLPHVMEIQKLSDVDSDIIDDDNDIISYKTQILKTKMKLIVECYSYDNYYLCKDYIPIYKGILFHLKKKGIDSELNKKTIFKIVKQKIILPQLYLMC